jgi:DNA polymerase-3 subunit beta
MKFICTQGDLNTHLSLVSRAVPSRPTHPVLGNVLLVADADKGEISLTAFDLSLGIRTRFRAQVTEAGKITLPAKLFTDIVSRLSEGELTLTGEDTEGDDGEETQTRVTLTSASGRFQIRGMSASEFPELPVISGGETVVLPILALTNGLKGALFAASTDETKQVLTGVHLKGSPEYLEFAATDGHRLAVVQTPLEESELSTGFSVTIPARALRELERMMAMRQDNDTVTLQVDEGQVIFELGEQRITSRKLDGAYPAYQQLIPRSFSRSVSLERKRLLSGLELVSVLADQKNHLVKFTFDADEGQLALSVESPDLGNAKEAMPAEISGEGGEIAFNVKYLMDGLKALPSADISLQLNESTQPVIFSPLGGLKMTYLVMPVQIRS